jgi:hypothetical protein
MIMQNSLLLAYCAYSSLKKETLFSFKTLVNYRQIMYHRIPKDIAFHVCCLEHQKFHMNVIICCIEIQRIYKHNFGQGSKLHYAALLLRHYATSRKVGGSRPDEVALVRERTIPTERPLIVGEVSANFCGLSVY